jgi:16S rRNA U516 pseudouridylate synthase RsuA-like enzyme
MLYSINYIQGLIILTSDGRLPNAVLRGMNKQPKVYEVEVDYPLNEQDMHRLRVSYN